MQDDVRLGIQRIAPVETIPLHVQVEVTWRCNWRCVHCYQDDHEAEPLTTAVLADLFEQLPRAGAMHLIVTGGEPLVRRDLFELLAVARRGRMAITLYTNGHAIDDAVADRLAATVAVVEVSLLAGDPIVHDELARVKGAFARTMAAIERLVARDVKVIAKTPVMLPAWPSLPALRDQLIALGVEWQPDLDITATYDGDEAPLRYRVTAAQREQLFAMYPEYAARRDPGVQRGLCLAGRQFVFVDALGEVYPCLNFRSATPLPSLGNIQRRAFAEIWRDAPLLHEIRKATRADFRVCGTCGGQDTCRPCMAHNLRDHGSLFEPSSSTCEITAAQQPGFVPASRLRLRS